MVTHKQNTMKERSCEHFVTKNILDIVHLPTTFTDCQWHNHLHYLKMCKDKTHLYEMELLGKVMSLSIPNTTIESCPAKFYKVYLP